MVVLPVVHADSSLPRTILLATEMIATVATDVKRHGHGKERGGILLGFRRGEHLHITEATVPTRRDVGSMFSFRRSAAIHREVALKRWRHSGKTMDWVGEWHSHPEENPSPSSIDLRSWSEMTERRDAPMVFLIVGWRRGWLGLCIPRRESPIQYREVERSRVGLAFQPA